MKIVEGFSGGESLSRVARERGHRTFTIDINPKVKPDLCKDILKVEKKDIPFKPDLMWFSPPCINYSHAKRGGISYIELSNMYVIKSLSLILVFQPKFWIIENPQTGTLKFQYFMKDLSFTDVSYCKYGKPYKKQTRLWNNFGFKGKICNKDCEFIIGGKHKDSVGNARGKYTQKNYSVNKKYNIPKELILSILNKVEEELKKQKEK